MNKDEALRMALEALENHCGNYKLDAAGQVLQNNAITAIKRALAHPEQEPVEYTAFQSPHNDDQWLENPEDCEIIEEFDPPVFVGFEYELTAGRYTTQRYRVTKIADDDSDDVEVELVSPTSPPARKWVGLTDDDIFKAIRPLCDTPKLAQSVIDMSMDEYQAIEAKLKEKNT
jgi:hypothetical protein